ncbi:MAG: hypothetical protein SWN10_23620, partial [Pseudomonadota bacterium]|nr:hypothetical protein [Pseudomonadota bacterium]
MLSQSITSRSLITLILVALASSVAATETRQKPWQTVDINKTATTVTGFENEVGGGGRDVDSANTAAAPTVYESIQDDADFQAMKDRTDQQGQTFNQYDERVSVLENLDRHWEDDPGLTSQSDWQTVSENRATVWTPQIDRQTQDFVQTADYLLSQTQTINEYETNYVTGEARLSNTRIENRNISEPRSRVIQVATTSWINSAGKYGCSWSPSPS